MSEIENANKLFSEISSDAPVKSVVFNEKDVSWVFRLEGDGEVTAAYEARSGLITFAAKLGEAAGSNASKIHRMLLQFSFLWRETGGFYAALDERETPMMMFSCNLSSLEPGTLGGLLNGFNRQQAAWSEIISRDDTSVGDFGAFMPSGGIRV